MDDILTMVQELALATALNILLAVLILLVGIWFSRVGARWTTRFLQRTAMDATLIRFSSNGVKILVMAVAIIAALSRLGVQTTSLVALLGAAGLAIGLALEGALANFAAGVLLLVFRPFQVGDTVEVAGDIFGTVEEIQIFNSIVITPENKTVIIPNGQITGAPIVNLTRRGKLRLDMVFGIGYGDDIQKARNILVDILQSDNRILPDPPFVLGIGELAESSVNFYVRPFVAPGDYWGVRFDVTEAVKHKFDEAGISIPYPQRDVHLFQQGQKQNS